MKYEKKIFQISIEDLEWSQQAVTTTVSQIWSGVYKKKTGFLDKNIYTKKIQNTFITHRQTINIHKTIIKNLFL